MPNGPPAPEQRPEMLQELDEVRDELRELADGEADGARRARLTRLEHRLTRLEGYALALLDAIER
ncbi:hypothetical protein FY550_00060 [Kushneria phosphatilytica]|uniref:Uncharacterized protein n=1 Tax=Kushneria phosphatilytica TaxID=657387 RepID=A0A5C0ZYB5_9GAMM|nr:hypothetical protein [Kushneria phosphatilytica]QEL09675.1 hypothetical protein FY550_00060 [Kushneria phosphatilytica]